jgi:hypothetical protein
MYNSPYASGDLIPTPKLVSAWAVVGRLATERVPMWAAHWLVQGYDGPALRELAGLDGADPIAVRELLPTALGEAGVTGSSDSDVEHVHRSERVAWLDIVYRDVAQLCLDGRASGRWVVDKVAEIVSDQLYSEEATASPLGELFGLDDEWGAGWGRSDQELTAEIQRACRRQVELPPTLTDAPPV